MIDTRASKVATSIALGLGLGLGLVLVLVLGPTGCTSTGGGVEVERVIVCLGPDDQHPVDTPVELSLRQGGREVAAASTQYGVLVELLVPSAQTAIFADGVGTGGAAGFGGDSGELDPASQPAPDDATSAAAAAAAAAAADTDPSTVNGYIGVTGLGCPPAFDLDLA